MKINFSYWSLTIKQEVVACILSKLTLFLNERQFLNLSERKTACKKKEQEDKKPPHMALLSDKLLVGVSCIDRTCNTVPK